MFICNKYLKTLFPISKTQVIQKLQLKEKEDSTSEFDPQLEPLLDGGTNRFVIFPIHYPDIWDMYKKVEANFWTVQEVEVGISL